MEGPNKMWNNNLFPKKFFFPLLIKAEIIIGCRSAKATFPANLLTPLIHTHGTFDSQTMETSIHI